MFKQKYNAINRQISPDKSLLQDTINKAAKCENRSIHKGRSARRLVTVLACICVCTVLAMPVLATAVEPVYQLMYMVSPAVAQFFMPVQKADENNGIKMEVVSAYIHNDVAEIYITLQDVTENRIDATIDLFDSYTIHCPFDSNAHCERVGYDEATKTATFLITETAHGGKNIAGDKITFTVQKFLSRKIKYNDISVPLDLSTLLPAQSTQTVSPIGGGGTEYPVYVGHNETLTALIPAKPMQAFAVEGIELTGIGYIDGKLHIQTAVKDNLDKDNHGFFYLKDSNGNKVDCLYQFNFLNQSEQPGRIDYCNYVFDIPQSELTNYTLHGDFVTAALKTEGPWQVTFALKQQD